MTNGYCVKFKFNDKLFRVETIITYYIPTNIIGTIYNNKKMYYIYSREAR